MEEKRERRLTFGPGPVKEWWDWRWFHWRRLISGTPSTSTASSSGCSEVVRSRSAPRAAGELVKPSRWTWNAQRKVPMARYDRVVAIVLAAVNWRRILIQWEMVVRSA